LAQLAWLAQLAQSQYLKKRIRNNTTGEIGIAEFESAVEISTYRSLLKCPVISSRRFLMKEQTPHQSVVDPQELVLAQLFDRLAVLGRRVRKKDQATGLGSQAKRSP
jgi:hypothetical protein